MQIVSKVGVRALVLFGLVAGGLFIAASSDAANENQTTTGTTKKAAVQKKNGEHHPSHVHAALHELKEARYELRESHPGNEMGGHKEKALHAINHAINELEALLPHHPHTKK